MNFNDDVISCLYEKLTDQVRTARTALWSAYQLFNCCEINDITNQLMNRMIDSVSKHLLRPVEITEMARSELSQFQNKLSEIDHFSGKISKNTLDSVHKVYSPAVNDNKWPMYTPSSGNTNSSSQPIIWSGTSLPFYQQSIIQSNAYNQDKIINNSNERLRNLISNQRISGQVYANSTLMLSQSIPRSIQPTLLITPSLISGSNNNSSRYPCHPPNSQLHHHHLQQQQPQPQPQHPYLQHQPTSVESCNNHDILLSTGFYKNCM
ncbi:unnamed protein product [Trichobilharzia szidati]|nr:unnamed protein product [Trichobilharzia szidati]